jgi:TRAP-type C4-dicarboxylate transport system permease small subunit
MTFSRNEVAPPPNLLGRGGDGSWEVLRGEKEELMKGFFAAIKTLSRYMYRISGVALGCILFLTVADVIMRMFNRAITGIYDLTMLLGGVVVGLAIPLSTWEKAHVYMDFLIDKGPPGLRKILTTITTCCGIFLFLMLGWDLILFGIRLHKVGEVSGTIHLPIYPFTLGIGVSFLLTTLVLLDQLVAVFRQEEKT